MKFRGHYVITPHCSCCAHLYSWGQSSGALSIEAHLVTNPINPPFKVAIFVRVCKPRSCFDSTNIPIQLQHSSYTTSVYRTDSEKHQAIYDHPVQFTGCSSSPDTLEYLRVAPYATLKAAIHTTPSFLPPNGLDITWGISIDGELTKKSLKQYVNEGCYASVPTLGGQVDNEGTRLLFLISIKGVTLKRLRFQPLFSLQSVDHVGRFVHLLPCHAASGLLSKEPMPTSRSFQRRTSTLVPLILKSTQLSTSIRRIPPRFVSPTP